MTDLRRVTTAFAAVALVLVASGCGGDDEPAPTDPGSATSSPSGTSSAEPTEEPTEEPTSGGAAGGDGYACEAIDVQVAGADNDVPLEEPSGVGEIGGDEGCSLFQKDEPTVVEVELVTEHGDLDQEGAALQISGQEEIEDVTVGGSPALLVRGAGSPVYVNLATLAGDRLLTIRLLAPGAEPKQVEQYERVVLSVAEQVVAAA
ncbi:hypothetical protein [Nocardioides sp. zg-1228]|uniref:hypothetical protein n=1 Tax=Nocardioides sp. zg-1228 TaxID=2763008 RepID=UPI00164284BF|nr:hypothetical protein [Nocardioides sp. zg-1228]MBC2934811.1 hypothetical protein [Nocardioides sp. zg-1228]QSF58398.1 hypothetical protein JX575_04110 [Nocardioides sp. zg-1228]